MNSSDEITNEVARLMRDPDALRHERERMPSSGRGHYDSSQPRVPAGQSGGGQWADTGRSAVKLAQAQEQSPLSLKELVRICALDPAKIAADFANHFMPGVGRVIPSPAKSEPWTGSGKRPRKWKKISEKFSSNFAAQPEGAVMPNG